MKKLTAILLMICLLASLSCAAFADGDDGTQGGEARYLSWLTARRVIQRDSLKGEFVKLGDYDLRMWVPEALAPLDKDKLPSDDYITYFMDADKSMEVGVQVIEMGEGFTLQALEQQLGEMGLEDGGIYVINGFYGHPRALQPGRHDRHRPAADRLGREPQGELQRSRQQHPYRHVG